MSKEEPALLKIMMSRRGMAFDRFMVRWTGISVLSIVFARVHGYPFPPMPLLLLAKGRKSGRTRSTVLPYFEINGRFFLVGSNGGAAADPQWVGNLRADPDATIYVRRKPRHVKARIAAGDERKGLWDALAANVPTYREYQAGTAREIPLVILEPA